MEALILSCSTGGGHNAVACALQEEWENRGDHAVVLDPYDLVSGTLGRKIGNVYIRLVQKLPKLFGAIYQLGDAYRKLPIHSPVYAAHRGMEEPMLEYLQKHSYDVILTTHLYPGMILARLKARGYVLPPTIFVVTDYTCIPFTEETDSDYYVIPSSELTEEFESHGLSNLLPFGIPVRQAFQQNRYKPLNKAPEYKKACSDKENCIPDKHNSTFCERNCTNDGQKSTYINQHCTSDGQNKQATTLTTTSRDTNRKSSQKSALDRLNLPADKKYLLLVGGSMGAGHLQKSIEALQDYLAANPDYVLIVICGSNEALYQRLRNKYEANPQIQLLSYTNQFADYMAAAEILISKPGGITSTEAAAYGIPLIHTSPIPGCETKNSEFYASRGMSIHVSTQAQLLDAVEQLSHPEAADRMLQAQHNVINPDAAVDICDFAKRCARQPYREREGYYSQPFQVQV